MEPLTDLGYVATMRLGRKLLTVTNNPAYHVVVRIIYSVDSFVVKASVVIIYHGKCFLASFSLPVQAAFGLYCKSFTIVIYDRNDSTIVIYDHNDSGPYYKTTITAR